MTEFIMQMRPLFGSEEALALAEYMKEDGFITEFKRTAEFESLIAEYTGARHCIVVNNGTVSLTLAGLALGLAHGDEVIVPNFTMIATPNSQKLFGAKPVFVDVEPDTLCLDLQKVEAAITDRTKAIMLVSANGRYPQSGVAAYEQLAVKNGLVLIEDAAQALGSFYPDGRHIGTAGAVGSFSFSAPKIISTGQGGALVTNDDAIAQTIRKLKDFGRSEGGNDIHDSFGLNFKFTELQACVGIEQMKKLPSRVARKKEIWARYEKNLRDCAGIRMFEHDLNFTTPWFIDCMATSRNELMASLKSSNVGTRMMYPPINRQAAYSSPGSFPVSEAVGASGLWLPSAVQLSNDDVDYICRQITTFYS